MQNDYLQRQAILFNSFNQIITNTLTGDIMVLFLTDVLFFKSQNITLLLSLIPLVCLIRLPLIFLMKKNNYIKAIQKSLIIKLCFVAVLLLMPLKLLSFGSFFALILIYRLAVEYGVGICWQPLMREITDKKNRGSFFGKMRFCFMTLNSLYVFFLSFFIKDALSERQYKLLLLVCLLGLFIQYYAIGRLSAAKTFSSQVKVKHKKSIRDLVKENPCLRLLFLLEFLFLWAGVSLNVVYLKSALTYSSKAASVYITVFHLSSTLLLPFAGKVLDKNYRKGLSYICTLYLFYLLSLFCLPPFMGNRLSTILSLLFYALVSGMISSGIYLLTTLLQHACIRSGEDSFVLLNGYQMLLYIASFLVTNFMGFVITWAKSFRFSLLFISLDAFRLTHLIAVLVCLALCRYIKKSPQSFLGQILSDGKTL